MNEVGVLGLRDPLGVFGYKYDTPSGEDTSAINTLYSHSEPSPISDQTTNEQIVDTLFSY